MKEEAVQTEINPVLILDTPQDESTYKPGLKTASFFPDKLEVLEKKSLVSKTFQIAPGQFSVVIEKGPIHYKDSDGKWQDIDLSIQQNNGKFTMVKAPYRVEIFSDRAGYKYTGENGDSFTIELVKIGLIDVDNSVLKTSVGTSQVFWDGLVHGISFKILLLPQQPKIYTKIDNESCPRTFTWKITQSAEFDFKTYGFDDKNNTLETTIEKSKIDDSTFLYTEIWTGQVSRLVSEKTRQKKWFTDPAYPVIVDPTITVPQLSNADQGSSYFSGYFYAQHSYFGNIASLSGGDGNHRDAGYRFQNVGVPNGATINSATLKLQLQGIVSALTGLPVTAQKQVVTGNKVGNAAAWSQADKPKNMAKTTSVTNWTPTASVMNSIDVTSQVAEIVGMGSWASNNAMKFGFGLYAPTAIGSKIIQVFYNSVDPTTNSSLVIDYSSGPPPPPSTSVSIPTLALLGVG